MCRANTQVVFVAATERAETVGGALTGQGDVLIAGEGLDVQDGLQLRAGCTPMRPGGRIRLQAALTYVSGCFVVYRASSAVQSVATA